MKTRMTRPLAGLGLVAALGLAPLVLLPSTASATIAFVQQNTGSGSPVSSLTVTLTNATKVGDLLVMVGADYNCNLASVTGGGVTTWSRATYSTTNSNIEIWYGTIDTASSAGAASVTTTLNTGCGFPTGGQWMNLSEWSGAWPVVDQAASASGTTSSASVTPTGITTTNASDLVLFGAAESSGYSFTAPTGSWTGMAGITTPAVQSSWYQITSATGTYNPSAPISPSPYAWDAAIAAFKACAVTDPSYVVANGQNGQATVYWTTSTPVFIVRNTTGTFSTTPTNGTQYCVTSGGGCSTTTLGSDSVVYVGEAGSFTQTSLTATTTYYYKVFANCGQSYSPGVVVNVKPTNGTATPPTAPLWSYATTATTLAAPGIDDNDVVVWGGNDYKIHGANAANGTLAIAPYTTTVTTGAIQSRPTVIPAAYSATNPQVNVAYVTSQDGHVYAINTSTGVPIWNSNITGPPVLQGGAAVFLKAIAPSVQICGANTDVVFVGTRNTSNHTGNVVYALNGSNNPVATTAGGNCPGGSIGPGGIMWQFTGAAGSNPSMDYISSTPYIDYNPNPPVLWVTSRAQAGTSQPSLWKFNLTNGTLANTTCGAATPSVWCLGDIDTSPAQSADGTWMYVTTAMATPTLQAVQGATVYSYTPSGSGVLSAPVPVGNGSFGTTTTIAPVNSAQNTATSSTTCQVTLPSMTVGNAIVVVSAVSSAGVSVSTVTDSVGSFYTFRNSIGTTGGNVEMWTATAGASAGSTVTITYSGSVSSVCIASQYSGVGSIGAKAQAFGTTPKTGAKTATISLPTNDGNNYVVAGFASVSSTAATASLGTLRQSAALGTPIGGALSDNTGPAGSVTNTVTLAGSSINWAAVAVELRSVTVDSIAFTQPGLTKLVQFSGTASATFYSPAGSFGCSCGGVAGNPVYDGAGRIYLGSSTGAVWRFDSATFVGWRTSMTISGGTTVMGDPSFDGLLNRIYVGSADGHVYAINAPF